jgi:hypothetical protein
MSLVDGVHVDVGFRNKGACRPNYINTALLGTYDTDNRFTDTVAVSTNILITSHIHVFLSFHDSDIPHHSYSNIRHTLELIIKILSVFYILIHVLKLSILQLRTGLKTFVIYPLCCTPLLPEDGHKCGRNMLEAYQVYNMI